jgi:two-component system response regulator HydG
VSRNARILIIDDEPLMRMTVGDALKEDGSAVSETGSGREGIDLLREGAFDIVITDLRLPDMDGIEVLKASKRHSPSTMVVLMTAYGSVDTAVEAMKFGAYDYLTKPFSMDELLIMVKRLMRFKYLEEENLLLREEARGRRDLGGMIGKSDRMKEVFEKVRIVAQTDSTVILYGESGTGKELAANAIHHNSQRKDGPFVKVSCAALPETLLEAELFGHEKGAFTGAIRQKKGRFELADKGTIFLDEIGEISQAIQVKLLRVLQEKEFDRLGGTGTIGADVRVICATQRDLKKEVQRGAFREDLYYRLNVVPITLPPLRERKEDVLLLADHFLKYYAGQYGRPARAFSTAAKEMLLRHPFPGNVREIENAVERAVVLGRGEEVQPWELSDETDDSGDVCHGAMRKIQGGERLSKAIRDFERLYIARVLEETKGNKTLAARLLGVSRKTLWEKCKMLEIMKGASRNQES